MAKMSGYLMTGFKLFILVLIAGLINWLAGMLLALIGISSILSLNTTTGAVLFFGVLLIIAEILIIVFLDGFLAQKMWHWK